jgi:16S rRNA (adenine1518-N6/adenine1519-N6)-dimethyltransferase
MTEADAGRATFARYRDLMAAHGFRPSRRFGQNFLLEPALHRTIADAVDVGPADLVVEVGPGLGFLTRELARRAGGVVAVEIDPRLARILAGEIREMPGGERVELLVQDVLGKGGVIAPEVESAVAAARGRVPAEGRLLVVANLPYAVTGPFLAALVQAGFGTADAMSLLVQFEFAERVAARAGEAAYGGPSGLLQAGYDVDLVRKVGREVFRPRPQVDSAIVRLRARHGVPFQGWEPATRSRFARFVRALFAARRKTLRHGLERAERELGSAFPVDAETARRRAEELGADELVSVFLGGGAPGQPDSPGASLA